jgi:hypothetical protein
MVCDGPSVCRSLIPATASAIIGQGTSENEIKAFKFAGHRLSDDPVDRRVQGLAGLVAAEETEPLDQRGVEPHGEGLLVGVAAWHLEVVAQPGLWQQGQWPRFAVMPGKPSKPGCAMG